MFRFCIMYQFCYFYPIYRIPNWFRCQAMFLLVFCLYILVTTSLSTLQQHSSKGSLYFFDTLFFPVALYETPLLYPITSVVLPCSYWVFDADQSPASTIVLVYEHHELIALFLIFFFQAHNLQKVTPVTINISC